VPLLIIDDLGMRKLPLTAAEELLEIIMRRYEQASTMLTSNRPVEDWGKLLATRPPSALCLTACSVAWALWWPKPHFQRLLQFHGRASRPLSFSLGKRIFSCLTSKQEVIPR
jgi:IstB-like ATP binding protein